MSDERRTPEDQPGADDQALGEALGSAIRERVDAPAARPPVSWIAERAAARAKARNTRRAVVGIAASAALAVGGIATWNALDNEQPNEVVVVDQPVADNWAAPFSAPGADDAQPGPPPVASETSGRADLVTPVALSTGTPLEWEELDLSSVWGAGEPLAFSLVSTGDGRVVVQIPGNRWLISSDGKSWERLPLPGTFGVETIDITGNRWLVAGWRYDNGAKDAAVSFSDDQGRSWTDLGLPLDNSKEKASNLLALISGKRMVLAVESTIPLDIGRLIVARGLAPDQDSITGWMSLEGSTVSFTRDENSPPESFELTPEEEKALFGAPRNFLRVFSSDGGPFEAVGRFEARGGIGRGSAEGFSLVVFGENGDLSLESPDGRQWASNPLESIVAPGPASTGVSPPLYYGSQDPIIWTTAQTQTGYRVERLAGVYGPPLVAQLPEGIERVDRLATGPAGVAVIAVPGNPARADVGETIFRVAKDGYELRYGDPPGGLSLWNLATEAVVYSFDAKVAQGPVVPEGVRIEDLDDGSVGQFVFEDPVTGTDLVAFTQDDLDAMTPDAPAVEGAPSSGSFAPEEEQRWLGWSLDGGTWTWQTVAEAFSLDEGSEAGFDLAVGDGFVIAQVQIYQIEEYRSVDGSDDGAVSATASDPSRLFIARVD